jgi:hypothetical protein
MKKTLVFVLGSMLSASLVMAQAPAASTTASKTTPTKTTAAAPAKAATPAAAKTPAAKPAAPNAGDIAASKAKGLVWVNLNTKVYHPSADKEYGTTKNGKFMTEADAKAAGARAAKH